MLRAVSFVAVLLLAGCASAPPPVVAKDIDFRAELARQGEWIVVAPWGRVWHPNQSIVGPNFVPYVSGGGWVHGGDGWVFESPWPWGKFVFHYGRWFMADDLGWLWWPDQTWGPAWVEWRHGDGHVGWSPVPPSVQGARHQKPPWFYVKQQFLSARETQPFQLKPDEVARVHPNTLPQPPNGPPAEAIRAVGGMDRDPQPIAIPPPAPEPAVEAAPVEEPPAEPPPPPPKKKGKKKGKR